MEQVQQVTSPAKPDYAAHQVRTGKAPLPPRERLWPEVDFGKHALVLVLLWFVVLGSFFNSFQSGMTLDNKYIIEEYYKALMRLNPKLDLKSTEEIKLIFQNDYWWPKGISGLYRPITTLSYWLDYVVLTGKQTKMNWNGKPIDDKGRLIDSEGRLINDKGRLVDAKGRLIDDKGRILDERNQIVYGQTADVVPPFDPSKLTWAEYTQAPGLLDCRSYHSINLLLHWVNAMLIYFVSLVLLKRVWVAGFVAALFAAHPITVESVTNIIGRADMFAAFTVFAGLLAYMRSTKSTGWGRAPWLALLMLIVAFGLFAKESSIAVGVVVPLYWLIFELPRLQREQRVYRCLIEFCVWLVMLPPLIGMVAARDWVFRNSSPAETPFLDNPIRGIWQVQELNIPEFDKELQAKPLLGMSYIECKMTAVKVMGRLLLLLAVPSTLCSDYSYAEIPNFSWHLRTRDDWQAVIALVTLLAIAGAAVWLLIKGNKAAFFFICFFFVAAFPTSNLTVTIGSVMAERFMYLPLAGFTGIVAMLLFFCAEKLWHWLSLEDPDDFPWHKVLAGGVLSLLVLLYGIRTWYRNPVWKEDLTLWEDAILTSKSSFRCYQSLAFALYEKLEVNLPSDPNPAIDEDLKKKERLKRVARMISVAEGALPIVDKLPNHLNSSRLYLHLGMYYSIKAELLCNKQPDESLGLTADAVACYKQAIDILERGSQIDRAFNQVNKAKQRLRNDPPSQITDAGLGPVYGTLGIAYARLQDHKSAYGRLVYMRQLDPTEIDAYLKMASVQVANGKYDDACATLLQCLLMDNQRQQVWQTLIRIYNGAFGEQASGAILLDNSNGQIKLNPSHPLVRRHLLWAYRDFIRTLRLSHRFVMAEEMGRMAKKQYDFPADMIDALFDEPVHVVTPEGVQYDQEEKELRGYRPPTTEPTTAPAPGK